jgi:hypothetical protein
LEMVIFQWNVWAPSYAPRFSEFQFDYLPEKKQFSVFSSICSFDVYVRFGHTDAWT